jgi:hypothetical protein
MRNFRDLFRLVLRASGVTQTYLYRLPQTLGRLPDPWWSSFEERTEWFEEDGEPKSVEAQERADVLTRVRWWRSLVE